jgi:hypothetical protein
MDKIEEPSSDGVISERDVVLGSLIVAIGLLAFRIGYSGGRDIGSVLFN